MNAVVLGLDPVGRPVYDLQKPQPEHQDDRDRDHDQRGHPQSPREDLRGGGLEPGSPDLRSLLQGHGLAFLYWPPSVSPAGTLAKPLHRIEEGRGQEPRGERGNRYGQKGRRKGSDL